MYPVYCSTCGKRVGQVMDKRRANDIFYCREHAPTSAARVVPAEQEKEGKKEKGRRGGGENKRRMPKENKGQ